MIISMVRDWRLGRDDVVRLEIGGVVQPDLVHVWDGRRDRLGFGFQTMGRTMFGLGALPLGWGLGPFGLGVMGSGAEVYEHRTVRRFVAGDYAVRTRVEDAAGNEGAWSEAVTVKHRPQPAAVEGLEVVAGSGVLSWTWTDS